MDRTLVFTLLMGPGMITLLGLFWLLRPPRKINFLIGYRMRRAMKSEASWHFAQRFAARQMMFCGMFLFVPAGIAVALQVTEAAATALILFWPVAIIGFVVFPTQSALKRRFH